MREAQVPSTAIDLSSPKQGYPANLSRLRNDLESSTAGASMSILSTRIVLYACGPVVQRYMKPADAEEVPH